MRWLRRRKQPPNNLDAWLAVGLGNPGRDYSATPHNAGSRALEKLARKLNVDLRSWKGSALAGSGQAAGTRIVLARPATFMNESGRAVAALMRLYRISNDRLIVLHDDIDLSPATLRLKKGGSSAGHRGVESIARSLGSDDFYRVRIGVGRPTSSAKDPTEYVLEPMSREAAGLMDEAEEDAADAVVALVRDGLERAMNNFNKR